MVLSAKILTILVLASLGLNVLLLFLMAASSGGARGRARVAGGTDPALGAAVDEQGRALQRLDAAIRQVGGETRQLGETLRGAVQHVGVVRFDAFEDLGGRLSFAAALLDGNGDGVVVSSINGRQDTRVYAKQIRGGASVHNLSDEEVVAIREALAGAPQAVEAR